MSLCGVIRHDAPCLSNASEVACILCLIPEGPCAWQGGIVLEFWHVASDDTCGSVTAVSGRIRGYLPGC